MPKLSAEWCRYSVAPSHKTVDSYRYDQIDFGFTVDPLCIHRSCDPLGVGMRKKVFFSRSEKNMFFFRSEKTCFFFKSEKKCFFQIWKKVHDRDCLSYTIHLISHLGARWWPTTTQIPSHNVDSYRYDQIENFGFTVDQNHVDPLCIHRF